MKFHYQNEQNDITLGNYEEHLTELIRIWRDEEYWVEDYTDAMFKIIELLHQGETIKNKEYKLKECSEVSPEDRRAIYEYALKRSEKIVNGDKR